MGNKACKEICRIDLFSDPKRFQAELGNPKYSNKPLKDLTPSEAVSGAAHEVSKKASEAVTKGIESLGEKWMEICVKQCKKNLDNEAKTCILRHRNNEDEVRSCLADLVKRKGKTLTEMFIESSK